jgi:hypothetical protein
MAPIPPKSPLRRSPRLANKRAANWREKFETSTPVDVFDSIRDEDHVSPKSSNASTETFANPNGKGTPKKSIVDPTEAVSPWGLPSNDGGDGKVDPRLALSPHMNTDKTTCSSANTKRVQFTSDTNYIPATSLRKKVTRRMIAVKSAPFQSDATRCSFQSPARKAVSTQFASGTTRNASSSAVKTAGSTPFAFGTMENASSRVFGAVPATPKCSTFSCDATNSANEPMGLEIDSANKENEDEKPPNVNAGLTLTMGTPIQWSPIKSSKPFTSAGLKSKSKAEEPAGKAVKFSSDVVFKTRTVPTQNRKATPHKRQKIQANAISSARAGRSLLQTGAVRMEVSYHINPRRKTGDSTRLIDSGAVRMVVKNHTNPRMLVGNRRMWYVHKNLFLILTCTTIWYIYIALL